MVSQPEARNAEHQARNCILWLLILAAALPLLPTGMFAGLALALVIAVWLFRAREVIDSLALWVLTAIVASENLVFIAGVLR